MGSCLLCRDHDLAIRTLDVLFILLCLLYGRCSLIIILKATYSAISHTCKLLLSAEDFGVTLSINVQDLHVRTTNRNWLRIPDSTTTRSLLLTFFYTPQKRGVILFSLYSCVTYKYFPRHKLSVVSRVQDSVDSQDPSTFQSAC